MFSIQVGEKWIMSLLLDSISIAMLLTAVCLAGHLIDGGWGEWWSEFAEWWWKPFEEEDDDEN